MGKDDILHHIIGKGLFSLRDDIKNALDESEDFLTRYHHICSALKKYYEDCPLSAENIIKAETGNASPDEFTPAVKNIFALGEEINLLMAQFIEDGKTVGTVQGSTKTMQTVYVLWSSISSLLALTKTKGRFLSDTMIQQYAVNSILSCNEETSQYGLALTEEQAAALVLSRNHSLKASGRIELGGGVIEKLIHSFADSPYINIENYEETLHCLIDIFYSFKSDTWEAVSDEQLIEFMKDVFDGSCRGSLEQSFGLRAF